MGNPRTLPPLVRGKVTGVLDFFIDEIVICKNVLYLTENLDFIAQVQWWGEILPTCIRPKILQLKGKIISSSQSVEAYFHSVHYEIRTSRDLFKSYLKACEVVELSVYEAVENYVIGSAFLKNLSNLLNRNNDFISMPIIDCSGEEIGQIKIHINFFENPQNNKNQICTNKICDADSGTLEKGISELSNSSFVFSAEKTVFYDGTSKKANFEVEYDQYPEFDRYLVMGDKNNVANSVLSNYEAETAISNFTSPAQKKSQFITFPEVCLLKDSSKILKFDSGLKIKAPEKSNKSKLVDRFTSNLLQSRSKPKNEKSCFGISTNKEKFLKKTVLRNMTLKKPKMVVTNQMDSKVPTRKQSNESFSSKNSQMENPQTCNNKMVFDYLLGSVMTKENEESAVNYFKKMSPSHDIVCSINELCLTSDETEACTNKFMKHNLCFDLTNPIERNYYEKFFVKSDSKDFEIAKFLNEPESSSALQKWKSNDKYSQKDSFNVGSSSVDETVTGQCDDFPFDNIGRVNKITNNCARCKYYKKLEELDTIIDSLKHFEKNMLKQEKSLQLDFVDNLSKQGYKISDR